VHAAVGPFEAVPPRAGDVASVDALLQRVRAGDVTPEQITEELTRLAGVGHGEDDLCLRRICDELEDAGFRALSPLLDRSRLGTEAGRRVAGGILYALGGSRGGKQRPWRDLVLTLLGGPDRAIAVLAARMLACMEEQRAVAPITDMLLDVKDPEDGAMLALSLAELVEGWLPDEQITLVERCQNRDLTMQVAHRLGRREIAEAQPLLESIAGHWAADESVHGVIQTAIRRIARKHKTGFAR
jgi:hypothetical protein